MDGPAKYIGWVGWAFLKKISDSKYDPKNTKIKKKNLTLFAEKIWENILTYFQKFLANFSDFCQDTHDFTRFWKN